MRYEYDTLPMDERLWIFFLEVEWKDFHTPEIL